MILAEVIFSIITAIVIGILFYYVFKSTGPWGTFWSFLLILILVGLATSAWIEPIGPVFYNVAWIPILFVILLFAFFLAAASEPGRYRKLPRTEAEEEEERAGAVLGIFFWIFILFLLIATIWGIFI